MKELIGDILQSSVWASSIMYISNIILEVNDYYVRYSASSVTSCATIYYKLLYCTVQCLSDFQRIVFVPCLDMVNACVIVMCVCYTLQCTVCISLRWFCFGSLFLVFSCMRRRILIVHKTFSVQWYVCWYVWSSISIVIVHRTRRDKPTSLTWRYYKGYLLRCPDFI